MAENLKKNAEKKSKQNNTNLTKKKYYKISGRQGDGSLVSLKFRYYSLRFSATAQSTD